ncbi:MAG: peptide-methionine (S)-S-oxide reductase MsrA [Panacagrimonas sp.]
MRLALALGAALLAMACGGAAEPLAAKTDAGKTEVAAGGKAKAIFASGCFWCTESDFEKLPGVISVVSGYTGGKSANPTYEQVGGGRSGHTEAVEIKFDPAEITYAQLLEHFWRTHDPLDGGGQFCDRGSQYRPGIFYLDEAQKAAAEASRVEVRALLKQPILTEITEAKRFWPAEDYHQNYYRENSLRYRYYRAGCGRDARIEAVWGKLATPKN